MNQGQAQEVVLGAALVTGIVVAWTDLKQTGQATPSFKQLIAFLTLTGALTVAATFAPSIAGPFAVLVALAIITSRIGATA